MNATTATCPVSYPCGHCQRHQPIAAAGWTHGFGWSKCPKCSATTQKMVVNGGGNLTDGTPTQPVTIHTGN